MATMVWWKWVLSDAKASPRKFCGHPSSGRGGEGRGGGDMSQRTEPSFQSPVARYLSQTVRDQRGEGLMLLVGVSEDG